MPWSNAQYRDFWQGIDAATFRPKELPARCPQIFVYDLPPPFSDEEFSNIEANSSILDRIFGSSIPFYSDEMQKFIDLGWLRRTDMDSLASIVLFRLLWSHCRTLDPAEAELFFVPVLPKPKRCFEYQAACARFSYEQLSKHLLHFNEHTAGRHVFVAGKAHWCLTQCAGWWSRPQGLFAHVLRVSLSAVLPQSWRDDVRYVNISGFGVGERAFQTVFSVHEHPHLVSSPYPGHVHFPSVDANLLWLSLKEAWRTQGREETLMLFLGNVRGDVQVRARLQSQCLGYGDHTKCRWEGFTHLNVLEKLRARFCLEPAGDTPFRSSITDSLVLGCIPVLFNRASELMFWGGWSGAPRIVVPREEFLRGDIDMLTLLMSAPTSLVSSMSDSMRVHAHRFQISTRDDQSDAISVLLHNLIMLSRMKPPALDG